MEDKEQSLITHLEELRKTLIACFIALLVILPFCFCVSNQMLDFLSKIIIGKNEITFNYFAPMEVFLLQLKLSFLADLVICFPYIAHKLWMFILPALYENERKFIFKTVFFSSTLFCLGAIFCIFCILPLIINFGMSFAQENIKAVFGISNVINLALNLAFVFALCFQIPLIVHFLTKFDIVNKSSIENKRPYVVVVLLIFAALLTPPDIISQILLFVPVYLLFELGLLFSKSS